MLSINLFLCLFLWTHWCIFFLHSYFYHQKPPPKCPHLAIRMWIKYHQEIKTKATIVHIFLFIILQLYLALPVQGSCSDLWWFVFFLVSNFKQHSMKKCISKEGIKKTRPWNLAITFLLVCYINQVVILSRLLHWCRSNYNNHFFLNWCFFFLLKLFFNQFSHFYQLSMIKKKLQNNFVFLQLGKKSNGLMPT